MKLLKFVIGCAAAFVMGMVIGFVALFLGNMVYLGLACATAAMFGGVPVLMMSIYNILGWVTFLYTALSGLPEIAHVLSAWKWLNEETPAAVKIDMAGAVAI